MSGPSGDQVAPVSRDTTAALPPPEPGVTVHLESEGGHPLTAVTKDQTFVVTVDRPRPGTGDPPSTTTVNFTPPDGSAHMLTLKWDGGIKGPVHYRSEPVTIAHGAEGAVAITLPSPVRMPGSSPDQGVEFRVGGMAGSSLPVLGLDVPNGGTLTVSAGIGPGAATTSMTVYDSVNKMVIDFNNAFFARAYDDVIAAIQRLKMLPDSPAARQARKDLDRRFSLLEQARIDLANERFTDIDQAVRGSTWVQMIIGPIWEVSTTADVLQKLKGAENEVEARKERVLWTFVRDLTIGFYQFTISQLPLAGSLWGVLFGTDILGNKLDGWERVIAAFDLASQAAMIGVPMAMTAEYGVPRTVGSGPSGTVEAPKVPDITRAPAGARVEWSEDFGLEGRQAQKLNLVVEQHAALIAEQTGLPFRKIRVLVRKTGAESLGQAAEGHAFKAEPLKSKTNSATDVKGGWGSEAGPVSYYTPDQIASKLSLTPDEIIKSVPDPANPGEVRWVQPDPPAGVDAKVWKRAGQRIREYWDEKSMMDAILERGLAQVRPDGAIIDTGITNYALDPETHALVKAFDGPPGGTGKPIYGDPDLYGFFFEDGTPLTVEQIKPIVADLGPQWVETPDGWKADGARVMHPDIFSWDPHEQKNIDIKAAIMGAHEGQLYGWRETPEGLVPVVGPKSEGTEALILLGGVSEPPQVAYGGAPLPPKAVKGRDFGRSPDTPSGSARPIAIRIGIGAGVFALLGLGWLFVGGGAKPVASPDDNAGGALALASPSPSPGSAGGVSAPSQVAEGPSVVPLQSQPAGGVGVPSSQPLPADLCGLVTPAKAASILGAPVRMVSAPFYCTISPISQSKVHGVIFTNVTLAITPGGGTGAFASALSTAKTLGTVRAVSGLGDQAYDGPTGLLVLTGTTFLQVGRSAIFDPKTLGADAPFPVVEAFARLVLPALTAP